MNESVLIGKTERFLRKIGRKTIDIPVLSNIDYFIEIYTYFKENLSQLQDLRDTMEVKGYKAPYRSIVKYGRPSASEMQVEDLHDITRHTQHFRMKAAAKKNILDRIKSSIASHKIAIGNLEEYGVIKCSSCQNEYQGHDLHNIIARKCLCGSDKLELTPNIKGVYRLDIINFLPLSGDYMVKMSQLSPLGRESFRKIVRILKQEKRGSVKTLSLVVRVFEDGRWVRKRVNLDGINQVNYEKEIRKEYGPDARIEFMQFHRSRPSIINDKHVQTALSLGYVKLAEDKSIAIMDSVLRQCLKNPEKIRIYNDALEKSRRNSLKMGDFEDQMTLQRELMDEELQKKGLVDGKGKLDQEVEADLKLKEKIDKCLLLNIPRTLITWDIIKYYLTTFYDHRTKYSGSFPNLRPYLDTNQMKSFENFHKQAINILKNHLNENIPYISDISSLLTGKFEIEKKIKGLHVKTNPSAVGAAILNSVGDIDLDEAAQIFGLNPEEVKTERDKIETFQKPSSRAQQFLEMIK